MNAQSELGFSPGILRSSREGPPWLEKFLNCSYFDPCQEHTFNKNEKNHFCIDCEDGPLCSRGLLASHASHRNLQVRKASHADGVRVENVCKLLDISGIQTYIINNHRIVFLLRQAKGKLMAKAGGSAMTRHCQTCGRALSDPVKFCSIKCKLAAVRRQGIGGTVSLSLSSEVELSAPISTSKDFPFSVEKLRYASDLEVAGRQAYALEANQRKRKLELAFGTNTVDTRLDLDPLLSPVSVLQALGPSMASYSLKHAFPCSPVACSRGNNHLASLMPGYESTDQARIMRLELALIHRMLLSSYRKKSRKGLPQRAPLS